MSQYNDAIRAAKTAAQRHGAIRAIAKDLSAQLKAGSIAQPVEATEEGNTNASKQ